MGKAIVIHNHRNFAFRDGNPSATADGTDCFQVRFGLLEAKPLFTKPLFIDKLHGPALSSPAH
jgi:hypothetical protein